MHDVSTDTDSEAIVDVPRRTIVRIVDELGIDDGIDPLLQELGQYRETEIYPKGHHPNSKGTRFQPGQAANPSGRKKKEISLIALLKEELARIPTLEDDGFDGEGKSNGYWLVKKLIEGAREGDRKNISDILDRVEGKPVAVIAGPGGGPIDQQITIINKADLTPALSALVQCGAIHISGAQLN